MECFLRKRVENHRIGRKTTVQNHVIEIDAKTSEEKANRALVIIVVIEIAIGDPFAKTAIQTIA
jgi:hypothetical protein